MKKQILTSLAVIAGAQILKIGIFYAIGKAAERAENEMRMEEIKTNLAAMTPEK